MVLLRHPCAGIILLSRGEIEAKSTEFSKSCDRLNLSMAEGEGGYKPSEADVKPTPEKKGSFRELLKNVIKKWPTRVAYYRKIEELSERAHQKREQRRDTPPTNPTS
jgi:hypothetical protein